jgi:WD40 repeat protein
VAASGKTLVVDAIYGIYFYSLPDLQEICFFPDASQFYVTVDGNLVIIHLAGLEIGVFDAADGHELWRASFEVELNPWIKDFINTLPEGEREQATANEKSSLGYMANMSISPDGSILAISFGDYVIRLWNLKDGTPLQTLSYGIWVQECKQIAISLDNAYVATVEYDGSIAMWRVSDGKVLWRLQKAGHLVGQPFSADGTLLVIEMKHESSMDSVVYIRDTSEGREIGHVSGRVAGNPFSPDGKLLVTTSYGVIKLWSLPGLGIVHKFTTDLDWPLASFSPDGSAIWVNDHQQVWRLSDYTLDEAAVQTPTPTSVPVQYRDGLHALGHAGRLQAVKLLPDGRILAAGTDDGKVIAWWVLEGKVQTFQPPFPETDEQRIRQINIAQDNTEIKYCVAETIVAVSLADGRTRSLGSCKTETITELAANADLLAVSRGTQLDLVRFSDGQIIHNMLGHQHPITTIAFSPDGRYLATGSNNQPGQAEVGIWQTEPAKLLSLNTDHPHFVNKLVFSPDGSLLATYGGEGLLIYRPQDGKLLKANHQPPEIRIMEFSVDGSLLFIGGYRGGISIWDWQHEVELAVLQGTFATELFVSPDGANLLSASQAGIVHLWGVP